MRREGMGSRAARIQDTLLIPWVNTSSRFSDLSSQLSRSGLETDDRRLATELWEGTVEVDVIELELKYCERCSGLWLRARGTSGIYCNACVTAMEGPGAACKSKKRRLRPGNTRLELVRMEGPSVCMEGGHA